MSAKPKKRKQHELVGFVAIWAVDFQKAHKLDGLHPTHYRLLKKYGARMDSFTIATNAADQSLTEGSKP